MRIRLMRLSVADFDSEQDLSVSESTLITQLIKDLQDYFAQSKEEQEKIINLSLKKLNILVEHKRQDTKEILYAKAEESTIILERLKKALLDLEEKPLLESMPPCAEKSLLLLQHRLLEHSIEKLSQKGRKSSKIVYSDEKGGLREPGGQYPKYETPSVKEENLAVYDQFVNQLKREGNANLSRIEKCRTKISDSDWKGAYDELSNIKKELRPFGIQKFLSLVQKAEQTGKRIEGKSVIILLGKTGVGKSTMIHFLAGSKIIKGKEGNLEIDMKDIPSGSHLSQVIISGDMISETRHITAVEFMELKDAFLDVSKIMLCDTPGFDDTRGPEIDLANRVGIVNVLIKCEQVKPLILISQLSRGDRGEGLKELVRSIGSMFSAVDKKMLKSFAYVFTKYKKEQGKEIIELLKKIKLDQTSLDEKSTMIIEDMLKKIDLKNIRSKIVDPAGDKRVDFLEDLLRQEWIENPSGIFHCSVLDSSNSVLKRQIDNHNLSIVAAINRCDYDHADYDYDYNLVKYKMDELKKLFDVLKASFIDEALEKVIQYLIVHMQTNFSKASDLLARILDDGNFLKISDLTTYERHLNRAEFVEKLFLDKPDTVGLKNRFEGNIVSKAAYVEALQKAADTLRSAILQDLNKRVFPLKETKSVCFFNQEIKKEEVLFEEGNANKEYCIATIITRLDKVKAIASQFRSTELITIYENTNADINKVFDQFLKRCAQFIIDNQFEKTSEWMCQIHQLLFCLKDHLNIKDMLPKFEGLKEQFIDELRVTVKKSKDFLLKGELTKNDIQVMNTYFTQLKVLRDKPAINYFSLQNSILRLSNTLKKRITGYIKSIKKNKIDPILHDEKSKLLQNSIKSSCQSSLKIIKPLVDQIIMMRDIISDEFGMSSHFSEIIKGLEKFIMEISDKIEETLTLPRDLTSSDYGQILTCVLNMQNLNSIDTLRYSTIVEIIAKYREKHIQSVTELAITKEDFKHLPKLKKVLEQFDLMKSFEEEVYEKKDICENFKKQRENLERISDSKIRNILDEIKEFKFDEKVQLSLPDDKATTTMYFSNLPYTVEYMFAFVEDCMQISRYSGESKEIAEQLDRYLKQYLTRCIQYIRSNSEIIKHYFSGLGDLKALEKIIKLLSDCFYELEGFLERKELCQYIKKRGFDLDTSSQEFLKDIYEVIDDSISITRQQTAKLDNYSTVLRQLSFLDKFCKPSYRFITLLRKCTSLINEKHSEIIGHALDYIDGYNYSQLASLLRALESQTQSPSNQDNFQRIQMDLTCSLMNIAVKNHRNVTALDRMIDADNITPIVEYLKHIDDALDKLKSFLETQTVENLYKYQKEIKDLLEKRIFKFINNYIKAAIESCDFLEAEKKIKNIVEISDMAQVYCKLSINGEIEKIRSDLNDKLRNETDLYSEKTNVLTPLDSIMQFFTDRQPKIILEKLKVTFILDFNAKSKYQNAYNIINKYVILKSTAILDEFSKTRDQGQQKKWLNKFEIIFQTLPDDIQGTLKSLLQDIWNSRNEHLENQQELVSIKKRIDEFEYSYIGPVEKMIKIIKKEAEACSQQIIDQLKKNKIDLEILLHNIKIILKTKKKFGNLSDIKSLIERVKNNIDELFDRECAFLFPQIEIDTKQFNTNSRFKSTDYGSKLDESFDRVITLIDVIKELNLSNKKQAEGFKGKSSKSPLHKLLSPLKYFDFEVKETKEMILQDTKPLLQRTPSLFIYNSSDIFPESFDDKIRDFYQQFENFFLTIKEKFDVYCTFNKKSDMEKIKHIAVRWDNILVRLKKSGVQSLEHCKSSTELSRIIQAIDYKPVAKSLEEKSKQERSTGFNRQIINFVVNKVNRIQTYSGFTLLLIGSVYCFSNLYKSNRREKLSLALIILGFCLVARRAGKVDSEVKESLKTASVGFFKEMLKEANEARKDVGQIMILIPKSAWKCFKMVL